MWRWALTALIVLAAPARAQAATIALGDGPLLALAADDGVGYAVIGSGDAAKPLALVRSGGRGATTPVAFAGPGAEDVDIGAGPDGVQVAWSRQISSGLELWLAPATGLASPEPQGVGTGPPQIDEDTLAYPDSAGDATRGGRRLTHDAPQHRHLPLDAARGLVLDLDQRRTITQLHLLGPGAPNAPALSLPRLADVQASLAVAGGRAYVAYALGERAYLATAELASAAPWTTRRLADEMGGRPAVARAGGRTYVAYSYAGGIYLNGRRIGNGGRPLLASDGTGVFAAWTRQGSAVLMRAE